LRLSALAAFCNPPHPPSAPAPPEKARGEKALDGRESLGNGKSLSAGVASPNSQRRINVR
jgi:hypothetical protein